MAIPFEQPPQEQKVSEEKKSEVTNKGRIKTKVEFQHLGDEVGLYSMDFDGALGKDGVGIRIWIQVLSFSETKSQELFNKRCLLKLLIILILIINMGKYSYFKSVHSVWLLFTQRVIFLNCNIDLLNTRVNRCI